MSIFHRKLLSLLGGLIIIIDLSKAGMVPINTPTSTQSKPGASRPALGKPPISSPVISQNPNVHRPDRPQTYVNGIPANSQQSVSFGIMQPKPPNNYVSSQTSSGNTQSLIFTQNSVGDPVMIVESYQSVVNETESTHNVNFEPASGTLNVVLNQPEDASSSAPEGNPLAELQQSSISQQVPQHVTPEEVQYSYYPHVASSDHSNAIHYSNAVSQQETVSSPIYIQESMIVHIPQPTPVFEQEPVPVLMQEPIHSEAQALLQEHTPVTAFEQIPQVSHEPVPVYSSDFVSQESLPNSDHQAAVNIAQQHVSHFVAETQPIESENPASENSNPVPADPSAENEQHFNVQDYLAQLDVLFGEPSVETLVEPEMNNHAESPQNEDQAYSSVPSLSGSSPSDSEHHVILPDQQNVQVYAESAPMQMLQQSVSSQESLQHEISLAQIEHQPSLAPSEIPNVAQEQILSVPEQINPQAELANNQVNFIEANQMHASQVAPSSYIDAAHAEESHLNVENGHEFSADFVAPSSVVPESPASISDAIYAEQTAIDANVDNHVNFVDPNAEEINDIDILQLVPSQPQEQMYHVPESTTYNSNSMSSYNNIIGSNDAQGDEDPPFDVEQYLAQAALLMGSSSKYQKQLANEKSANGLYYSGGDKSLPYSNPSVMQSSRPLSSPPPSVSDLFDDNMLLMVAHPGEEIEDDTFTATDEQMHSNAIFDNDVDSNGSVERARPFRPGLARPSAMGIAPVYSYTGGKLNTPMVGEDVKLTHGSLSLANSKNQNGTFSMLNEIGKAPQNSMVSLLGTSAINSYFNGTQPNASNPTSTASFPKPQKPVAPAQEPQTFATAQPQPSASNPPSTASFQKPQKPLSPPAQDMQTFGSQSNIATPISTGSFIKPQKPMTPMQDSQTPSKVQHAVLNSTNIVGSLDTAQNKPPEPTPYQSYYFPQDSVKEATILINNGGIRPIVQHNQHNPTPAEISLISKLESDLKNNQNELEGIHPGQSLLDLLAQDRKKASSMHDINDHVMKRKATGASGKSLEKNGTVPESSDEVQEDEQESSANVVAENEDASADLAEEETDTKITNDQHDENVAEEPNPEMEAENEEVNNMKAANENQNENSKGSNEGDEMASSDGDDSESEEDSSAEESDSKDAESIETAENQNISDDLKSPANNNVLLEDKPQSGDTQSVVEAPEIPKEVEQPPKTNPDHDAKKPSKGVEKVEKGEKVQEKRPPLPPNENKERPTSQKEGPEVSEEKPAVPSKQDSPKPQKAPKPPRKDAPPAAGPSGPSLPALPPPPELVAPPPPPEALAAPAMLEIMIPDPNINTPMLPTPHDVPDMLSAVSLPTVPSFGDKSSNSKGLPSKAKPQKKPTPGKGNAQSPSAGSNQQKPIAPPVPSNQPAAQPAPQQQQQIDIPVPSQQQQYVPPKPQQFVPVPPSPQQSVPLPPLPLQQQQFVVPEPQHQINFDTVEIYNDQGELAQAEEEIVPEENEYYGGHEEEYEPSPTDYQQYNNEKAMPPKQHGRPFPPGFGTAAPNPAFGMSPYGGTPFQNAAPARPPLASSKPPEKECTCQTQNESPSPAATSTPAGKPSSNDKNNSGSKNTTPAKNNTASSPAAAPSPPSPQATTEADSDDDLQSNVRPPRPTKPKKPKPNSGKKPKPKPSSEKNSDKLKDVEVEDDDIDPQMLQDFVNDTKVVAHAEAETLAANTTAVDAPASTPVKQIELFTTYSVFGWEIPVVNWNFFTDIFRSFFVERSRASSGQFTCDESENDATILRSELDVDYLCGEDLDIGRRDIRTTGDSNVCSMFCSSNGFAGGMCMPLKSCLCYMSEKKNFAIKLDRMEDYTTNSTAKVPSGESEDACNNCRCLKSCQNHGKYVGYCSKSCHCGVPWYNENPNQVRAI